jgi:hypothetical protein
MACCGKKRAAAFPRVGTPTADPAAASPGDAEPRRYTVAFFQYLGRTRLAVLGPRSGRLYRFDRPRTVVAVDPRDILALRGVPQLRQVNGP